MPTTLIFATVNKKPAALVIEPANPPRAIASVPAAPSVSGSVSVDRVNAPSEITREIVNERVTAVSFDPVPGRYFFHDALTKAKGEIIVE